MKWVKVFDSPQIADLQFSDTNTLKIVIGKKEICLAKYNKQYFAVSNLCPHQFESLS